jgi:hypothetical protein
MQLMTPARKFNFCLGQGLPPGAGDHAAAHGARSTEIKLLDLPDSVLGVVYSKIGAAPDRR